MPQQITLLGEWKHKQSQKEKVGEETKGQKTLRMLPYKAKQHEWIETENVENIVCFSQYCSELTLDNGRRLVIEGNVTKERKRFGLPSLLTKRRKK